MSSHTPYLLALDQGTTSTRAMIFDGRGRVVCAAQRALTQHFPRDGWVEHDGAEILRTVMDTIAEVLAHCPDGPPPITLGITNQRETTLVWDRDSGRPIHPAIVWQDRRTADLCRILSDEGHGPLVAGKCGLLLDPYFSATKLKWILDHVAGARARAVRGELAFGTVDSFILWHLTKGRHHATDVTNASRTMLFNIHTLSWDPDLLALFDIPDSLLPEVHPCDHHYGDTDAGLFGHSLAITGIAGDQQAALIGQGCFKAGEVKATFGTGGFVMMHTGDRIAPPGNHLLSTVAYQMAGRTAYALEGSFFSAGSAVQWLRDGLKIITSAEETETLARSLDSTRGVCLVPAFTGLGAPHWRPDARGAILGLTRATGVAEIARAALEAVAFQTADLLDAMQMDAGVAGRTLKVDGGMVVNQWLLQFLADITQVRVRRSGTVETTAQGAALLSGLGSGRFTAVEDMAAFCRHDREFTPGMTAEASAAQKLRWEKALKSVC